MEYLNLRDAEGLCPPAYADGRLQIDPKLVEAYKKEGVFFWKIVSRAVIEKVA